MKTNLLLNMVFKKVEFDNKTTENITNRRIINRPGLCPSDKPLTDNNEQLLSIYVADTF